MRTTIELPALLARRAKIAAVRRGVTLKALIAQALERELDTPARPKPGPAAMEIPLVGSATPGAYELDPRQVADILLREECAAYEAAQRR